MHAARRGQPEHAAARQEQGVDAIDRADRLEHDDHGLAGRRAVVVDAGRRRGIEEDRGAAGRPPRVGEMPDADAGHVGQRSGRRLRLRAGCRHCGGNGREGGRRGCRVEKRPARDRHALLPAEDVSTTWSG